MVSQATYRIMGDRRKYKKELHKYHTVHSFYSITEFLGVELTKGMCKDNNFYYNWIPNGKCHILTVCKSSTQIEIAN